MAENNSIRNSYPGNEVNLVETLSSISTTMSELRDIMKVVSETTKKMDKSTNSSDSKRDKAYKENLEWLRKQNDLYKTTDKVMRQINNGLYKEFSSTFTDLDKLKNEHIKKQAYIDTLEAKMAKATANSWDKLSGRLEQTIKTKKDELTIISDKLEKATKAVSDNVQRSSEYQKAQQQALNEHLQNMTNLNSKASAFLPRQTAWNTAKTNVSNFFNPKNSREYKEWQEFLSGRRADISAGRREATSSLTGLRNRSKGIDSQIADLTVALQRLGLEGTDSATERQIAELQKERQVIDDQIKLNEFELSNLQEEEDLLDKQSAAVDKANTVSENIKNTALKFIKQTLTKAVDRELSNLTGAADKVFGSFESLQQTMGRQLKMSSGEYDNMKQQLMAAADAAGKAIDVTQLNEAAASMTEMGISDTTLITEMAVGIAKLSEAGVSAKLDEESAKQINATFSELVAQGVDETEAAKLATQRFDAMIGIQEQIRQQYGNTIALENGGWQEIQNWASKLQGTGDLTNDEVGSFMASTANALEAMTTAGITDPTALFGEVENVLNGKVSDQNAWMLDYLYKSGIYDTEGMYQKFGSGEAGDILVGLADQMVNILNGADATNAAYIKDAYGISMTGEQLRSFQKKTGSASALYSSATFDQPAIDEFGKSVAKGLDEGSYLSATAKLEKTNISLMQELASKYQDIPDGAFWMGEGFSEIKNIVDSAVDFLLTGLLSGNMFSGGANGGMFGSSGGTAGAFGIGTASKGGMALGGALSIASIAKNAANANSFEEGMLNTFRDPTFTAGLGTTIGSAVGGPIGGAIGGALGAFVPTVSEALEKWTLNTIHDPIVDSMNKQAEQLEQAAKSLDMAANKHTEAANNLTDEINEQRSIFNSYNDNQKEQFLKQQGLTDDEIAQYREKGLIDSKFSDAVEEWIAGQQKEKEAEELLAAGVDNMKNSFGSAINVDNNTAKWVSKAEGRANTALLGAFGGDLLGIKNYNSRDDMETRAATLGINTKGMNDKELAAALNAAEESLANTQAVRNESGFQTLADAKAYASKKGKSGTTEEIMLAYLQAMDPEHNIYTDKQMATIAAQAASMDKDMSTYNTDNEKFHSELKKIIDKNPGISYKELFAKYAEAHSGFDMRLIEDYSTSAAGDILVNGMSAPSGDMNSWPNLRHTARTSGQYNYDPKLYDGAFRTGLDYVPMDNFLALLHQGEMVLNKSEAEAYKSTFDTSSITNSVNTQTDKLTEILTKILQILTYRTSSGSNLPKSLVQMNSDIAVL